MSEQEISGLIDEEPQERTELLIRLFGRTSDENKKMTILSVLHHIGDQEIAGDFYAHLYQEPDLKPLIKFWIGVLGALSKFRSHQRLRKVLDAHLQGESPAKALLRALYPDGQTCRVKYNRRRLHDPQAPNSKRPKGAKQLGSVRVVKKPTRE